MHCEIIDCYFNIFFVEIQLKKKNLKSVFWVPKLVDWSPKGPENITNIYTHILSFFVRKQYQPSQNSQKSAVLKSEKRCNQKKNECQEELKEFLPGLWFASGWSGSRLTLCRITFPGSNYLSVPKILPVNLYLPFVTLSLIK